MGLKSGLRTEIADREKAKESVQWLYSLIDKKVDTILFFDSPFACNVGINLLRDLKSVGEQLENQLWNQLRNQLDNQLGSQLGSQLDNQIWNQLESQIWNQLGSQIWNQLENQLNSQLNETIKNTFKDFTKYYFDRSTLWQGYYRFYQYILEVLFPEEIKNFSLLYKLINFFDNVHGVYMFENIAIICEFPELISMKDARTHNDQDMCVQLS